MKMAHTVLLASLLLAAPGVAFAQATGGTVVVAGGGASGVTKAAKRPQGFTSAPPPLLLKAHTVFVSNAGADAGLFPHPFTGTQDRTYGYFCDRIDDADHFERVDNPADADIVLEVSLIAPPGSVSGSKSIGTGDALPAFKLVAYDRPTHYILWAVNQTVDKATLQKTHDKNLDAAVDSVFNQFMAAAMGKPMMSVEPKPEAKTE